MCFWYLGSLLLGDLEGVSYTSPLTYATAWVSTYSLGVVKWHIVRSIKHIGLSQFVYKSRGVPPNSTFLSRKLEMVLKLHFICLVWWRWTHGWSNPISIIWVSHPTAYCKTWWSEHNTLPRHLISHSINSVIPRTVLGVQPNWISKEHHVCWLVHQEFFL